MTPSPLPVLRGTLDLLVLRALLGGALHGYQISTWLDKHADGNLTILDSALYQALYRLERQQLISAEWGVTENNRQARYYGVTTRGRAFLRAETKDWLRYSTTVTTVLTSPLGGN